MVARTPPGRIQGGIRNMFINTNIAALNSQRHLNSTNAGLDKSLERLSSGLRINSGSDDASGLAIVERMAVQNKGVSTAIQNAQDGSALFKIADGALDQVSKMLVRMEELAVRAGNQTLTMSDRAAMKEEINQLLNHINNVADNTEYNTMKLLNGSLDVKKTITQAIGTAGSIRILNAPGTVSTAQNLDFTLLDAGSAAVTTGTIAATTSALGLINVIAINGVEISIAANDTSDIILSKINNQNSKTGVIGIKDNANFLTLVSGVIDADAANVINIGSTETLANGSALGYLTIGTAATIAIGGATDVWAALGFNDVAGLETYFASGTNAAGTLSGIAMIGHGNVLEMENTSSKAYGIKIESGMFNNAYGGYVINNTASLASAVVYTSYDNDTADISLDNSNSMRLHIGANYNQAVSYTIGSIEAQSLGVGASTKFGSLAEIDISTAENANISIKVIQKASTDVADVRANLGAIMNRLEYTDKTLQVQRENMTAAESKIRDADISLEMTNFTRQNIMLQAGTAMLAQANSKTQGILQLLK